MERKRSEQVQNDPVRELYAAHRELGAIRRARSNNDLPILEEMEANRKDDLNLRLTDFFLSREPAVGAVSLYQYKRDGFIERGHAFSENKFSLTLPSPMSNEDSFTVEARLSNLRRKKVIGSSIEAKRIISPNTLDPDTQRDFVSRTFRELDTSEEFRKKMLASNEDKDRRNLGPLKDLQEVLLVGRLLTLTQIEEVPNLRIIVRRGAGRLWINTDYQDQYFAQTFNGNLPRTPEGYKDVLRKAGIRIN